jgi:hypothetical protein
MDEGRTNQIFEKVLEQALQTEEIKSGVRLTLRDVSEAAEAARTNRQVIWEGATTEAALVDSLLEQIQRTPEERLSRAKVELEQVKSAIERRGATDSGSVASLSETKADEVPRDIKILRSVEATLVQEVAGLEKAGAKEDAGHERPETAALRSQLASAEAAMEQALLERGILPFLRAWLNEVLGPLYSNQLTVEEAPGLSELFDPRHEIPTAATAQVERLIEQMPGGSIGISGPRGSGKTTLIRSFCEKEDPTSRPSAASLYSFMVSAPVDYVPREFVLHIFAKLCRQVLGPDHEVRSIQGRSRPAQSRTPQHRPTTVDAVRRTISASWLPVGTITTCLGLALVLTNILSWEMEGQLIWGTSLIVGGTLVGVDAWRQRQRLDFRNDAARARMSMPEWERLNGGYAASDEAQVNASRGESVVQTIRSSLLPTGLAAAGLGVALALSSILSWELEAQIIWANCLIVGGILVGISGWRQRQRLKFRNDVDELFVQEQWDREPNYGTRVAALDWLKTIQFQQSYSSGWSGALRLPVGVEAGITGGTTLSELQMSFPDVVAAYRGFLNQAAARGRIVIGIDELDKMESEDKAREFLNAIKVIFGLDRCYYLISVSEDAMASFERRGIPYRDVFDSSFDEIVKVPYLDLEASRELLFRRIVGLPIPYVALCHCLSGGLARDLIRTARNLVQLRPASGQLTLGAAAKALVKGEAKSKTEAVMTAVARLQLEPEVSKVLGWWASLERLDWSGTGLIGQIEELGACLAVKVEEASDADAGKSVRGSLVDLCSQLGTYYYCCATILEFFDDKLDRERLNAAEYGVPGFEGSLKRLAESRQALAVNRMMAWNLISRFRRSWALDEARFPWV